MERGTGRAFLLLAIVSACVSLSAQTLKAEDPWAPLRFLHGDWSGTGSGKPGEAVSGKTAFGFDLDGNVMVRQNSATYAARPGEAKVAFHQDLMVIYRQAGESAFRAIYFDNEGHVIRYVLSFPPGGNSAVFESEAGDRGPRFRLTYALLADGSLSVDFAMAPPGGEFGSYTKGIVKRVK